MPQSRYINVSIDDQRLDLKSIEELPISISYKLEDPDNFQNKKSTEAFNVTVPATHNNDQVSNTFHNPGIEDLTADNIFRKHRRGVIEANSIELVNGKAFLINARHGSCPTSYEYNFYGNNGDWMIDLKEATLFDFLRHITFDYSKANIIASWNFDGTDEDLPYVFAPVRYGLPMEPYYTNLVMIPPPLADDYNLIPTYLKPSISKYWLLYWGFKSIGYWMASDFFDTEYFRRQVMPWTWGNFNSSAGTRLDNLDFLSKSTQPVEVFDQDFGPGFWDLLVSNDSIDGGFDNNGVYNYDGANFEMEYTYPTQFQYGTLEHHFHIAWLIDAGVANNSEVELRVQYFKNGVKLDNGNDNGNGTLLVDIDAPLIGTDFFAGVVDQFITVNLNPGDEFKVKMWLRADDTRLGKAKIKASVQAFELEFIKIPIAAGAVIDFENYTFLNKWKFLDLLRGVIDEFNLTVATDPVNKVVYIEPTHPYSLEDDQSIKTGGYFNGNYIDWEAKQDLYKESELPLFSDSDRELLFKYKNDSNDGAMKLVQDRNVNTVATGKYVLPDRFKSGKHEYENRFFAPTMHYDVVLWQNIGTLVDDPPQMVCIVPENISNTSADEAQNTFEPKSCYYKGLTTDWGWVFDTEKSHPYPYMFAVNYKPGGEEDPILSYCDERISGGNSSAAIDIPGKGLLKRFYHQRLAIMRNGQYYNTFFQLNNLDITNWLHREHIVCRGQKWELVEVNDYKPLSEETTDVSMRKWTPLTTEDNSSTFPSADEVLDIVTTAAAFDIPYAQLKCLASDIPK